MLVVWEKEDVVAEFRGLLPMRAGERRGRSGRSAERRRPGGARGGAREYVTPKPRSGAGTEPGRPWNEWE